LALEGADLAGDAARFPTNAELKDAILKRPQYASIPQNRLRFILEQLELASRDKFDETAGFKADLTIEHVLPWTWRPNWPLPDGRMAPIDPAATVDEEMRRLIEERESLKNTLGNLTLLTPSANPSLGNNTFEHKKNHLRASLLKLNQLIANQDTWDESAIRARGEVLAALAIELWPQPVAVRDKLAPVS
jgi:hypothetical protein